MINQLILVIVFIAGFILGSGITLGLFFAIMSSIAKNMEMPPDEK
jgi:hypothetical protein